MSCAFDDLWIREFGTKGRRVWQSSVQKPSCFRAHFGACYTEELPEDERRRAVETCEAQLASYAIHFCGSTPDKWYMRHAPRAIFSFVEALWRLLYHKLPPNSQAEPPNSYTLLRYDESNGRTAAEMNLHQDGDPGGKDRDYDKVAQVEWTAVLQVSRVLPTHTWPPNLAGLPSLTASPPSTHR